MREIVVKASRTYSVLIGEGLPEDLPERLRQAVPGAEKAFLLADDTVWGLYGEDMRRRLEAGGFAVPCHVFPHGEASKNAGTYIEILEAMGRARLSRSDMLLALGGGVTGDLGGFAAATYQRGIACVQLPTTLLAMVDSSVGGKTAIDLESGKNQAGAFWQPSLVLCRCAALDTLPEETLADGCAEVVKYGVLCDPELFLHMEERGLAFDRPLVVERCVAAKRDYVAEDEFDRGMRKLLNLGHTLGHALEKRSAYAISHGRAVSIGMAVTARAAVKRGLCDGKSAARLRSLLEKLGLPTASPYPVEELLPLMLTDKKWSGSRVDVILPETIGRCRAVSLDAAELRELMEAGC